jgi:hypothetical protein
LVWYILSRWSVLDQSFWIDSIFVVNTFFPTYFSWKSCIFLSHVVKLGPNSRRVNSDAYTSFGINNGPSFSLLFPCGIYFVYFLLTFSFQSWKIQLLDFKNINWVTQTNSPDILSSLHLTLLNHWLLSRFDSCKLVCLRSSPSINLLSIRKDLQFHIKLTWSRFNWWLHFVMVEAAYIHIYLNKTVWKEKKRSTQGIQTKTMHISKILIWLRVTTIRIYWDGIRQQL